MMKTILLIDDNAVIRKAISIRLSEAGWRVLEAEDGDVGITLAMEHKPDAIICDLLMPRCNGFQVCRALRAQRSVLPKTFIIVSSSREFATDRLNALEAGADEYLVKPIVPADLMRLLDRVVTGTEIVAAPAPAPGTPMARNMVKFWGVRGSIPTPGPSTVFYGGNTSCVEVRADGELIILDSGSGIRPLGVSLATEFKGKPIHLSLLLTHTHWDHIQGFPFFPVAYNPQNRLRIIGYEGSRQGLESTLAGQMESAYFPIGLKQMPGHIRFEEMREMEFKLGHVDVCATFVNHPGICVGYRINTSTGSVAYIPDHEPFHRMRMQPQSAQEVSPESIEFAKEEDRKLTAFIAGVDVLIVDSQYDVAEYETHVGWGHSCIDDSVALALAGKVKRLFLFHHDPSHDDNWVSRNVAKAREIVTAANSDLVVEAAREGLEVDLKPAAG
jgi:phosphoribosyl 1,2-cyclic phosphodiesterase/CheY-like chemotaxis protein